MAKDLSRGSKVHPPLGYVMVAHDGGLQPYEYWGDDPIPGVHCPECSSPIDHAAVSKTLAIRSKRDAFFADAHIVVSSRLRDWCLTAGYADVQFPCLNERRGLYELRPTRIVQVDVQRSEPLFSGFCIKCGNFDSYLLGRGIYLHDVTKPLRDGIYRTDLIIGCRLGKNFLTIVAPETRDRMLAAKLRDLRFWALPMFDPDFEQRKAEAAKSAAWWRRKRRAMERQRRMRERKGIVYESVPITKLFRS
jgi:hypothetical protein